MRIIPELGAKNPRVLGRSFEASEPTTGRFLKRLSTGILAAVFAAGFGLSAARAQSADFGSPPSGEVPILYNDHHVYAKPDTLQKDRVLAALVRGSTIFVPLRSMLEQMGATVSYDPATKTADISKAGSDVKVTVGKAEVIVNGESRPLDVPPEIYKGVVVVPVRVISEGMGAYVQWVPSKQSVVVRYIPPAALPPPPPPPPPPTPTPTKKPAPPVVVAPPPPTPAPTATPGPPMYQYSATAEVSYVAAGASQLSFGVPAPINGAANVNSGFPSRVFDYRPNTFTFNTLNLQASKSSAGVIGWKVELNIGNDANIMSSMNSYNLAPNPTSVQQSTTPCGSAATGKTGTGPTLSAWIPFPPFNNPYKCLGNGEYYHVGGYDPTQVYVQYATPNGKLTFTAGKFLTLVGSEVVESWNDSQFSRSILFGYAEPVSHTGVRMAYAYNPHLTLTVGGNNGWDDIVGMTGAIRSLESQIAYTNGNLSASASFLWGPEYAAFGNGSGLQFNVNPNGTLASPATACSTTACASFPVVGPQGIRTLLDATASYKLFPSLTLGANFDSGTQNNTAPFITPTVGAIWNGLAGYAAYTFGAGKYGVSGRYEFFSDPQGYRTGTLVPNLRWDEFTGTGLINLSPNVAVRGEYRMDYTNSPVFTNWRSWSTGTLGTLSRTQGTMSADLVVHY